jgi:peroxiredoxin
MPVKLLYAAVIATITAGPAHAELKVGEKAPLFTADAARAGAQLSFSMADALRRGPVILYFYPQGPKDTCYVENYEFSFVAGRLERAGITVVGLSSDRLAAVAETSQLECSDKMTLASDPGAKVIAAYDAQDPQRPGFAVSVGYVIAPDGRVVYARTNDAKDAVEHVADMVQAAETWLRIARP